ncbi:MAG: lipopolysaccharide heptosyltransferase II [Endomicrobiales bacterium]
MPLNNTHWNEAKNLLCVRLDTIGDVLMTTPALRALKAARTGRRITLLTSSQGAEVASLIPEIDRVIAYNAPWMKNELAQPKSRAEYAMADALRKEKFDGAVLFTVYSQNPLPSAFLCYLADIPLRLAYCHENPYHLLSDWVPDPEPAQTIRHEVQRQLDLARTVGASTPDKRISLKIPKGACERVLGILGGIGFDLERCWVVIHPGASAPSRRYPPESFALAARALVKDIGCQVIFTGTDPERELVGNIRDLMGVPSYSLVGKLNLGELSALISLSPLLISNNTGPVHIAAALGVRVVDLYALTNPQHTPWGVPSRILSYDVPCKYCYKSVCPEGHHRCLSMVAPGTVVRAAYELLSRVFPRIPRGHYTGRRSNACIPWE